MLSIPYSVFIVNFEHISHLCSSVSTVNFKHVIAGWVRFKSQLIGTAWLRVTEVYKENCGCDNTRLLETSITPYGLKKMSQY